VSALDAADTGCHPFVNLCIGCQRAGRPTTRPQRLAGVFDGRNSNVWQHRQKCSSGDFTAETNTG